MSEPATKNFRGFEAGALQFFDALSANNNRDWFLEHKDIFERTLKAPMMDLVADLSTALSGAGIPIFGDPKRALFRINRDVRFARDKSPYKTNLSAVLSRDGEKRSQGLLYLQFGADECFAAAGFYMLEPPDLAAFRQRIVAHPAAWRGVTAALKKAKLSLGREGAAERLPRGFDAAVVGDLANDLKLKSFIVSRPLIPADLEHTAVIGQLVHFAAASLSLLQFGWRALDERERD